MRERGLYACSEGFVRCSISDWTPLALGSAPSRGGGGLGWGVRVEQNQLGFYDKFPPP